MKKYFRISNLLKTIFLAGLFITASCQKAPIDEELNVNLNAKASPAANQSDETIADIVVSFATADNPEDQEFTLLLAALQYAGITSLLDGTDQFTVFAPTDQAFQNFLGSNSLQDFAPEQVAAILSYHVTDGRRFSNSVVPRNFPRAIETLLGPSIFVDSSANIDTNDQDTDPDASILVGAGLFDIPASNGVIHVIDEVLVPVTD